MSNPVFTNIILEGERKDLKSLYDKMMSLEKRKKSLIENGYGNNWIGNLATQLGGEREEVYCRGTWSELQLNGVSLSFFMETAWRIPCSLLKLIQKVYPSIQLYFTAEGDDWDFYLTNDVNGKYFSARYVVNMEDEVEYFDTIDEVANHLRPLFGKVVKTREEMYDAIEDWEKNNDDDQYLYIKEYSLCQLDKLTDLYESIC